jgi:hypothetical protein
VLPQRDSTQEDIACKPMIRDQGSSVAEVRKSKGLLVVHPCTYSLAVQVGRVEGRGRGSAVPYPAALSLRSDRKRTEERGGESGWGVLVGESWS